MKKFFSVILEIILIMVILLIIFLLFSLFFKYSAPKINELSFVDVFEMKPKEQNETISEKRNNITITVPQSEEKDNEEIGYRYYYSQLDSYSKLIYNKLLESKENLKQGDFTLDFDTTFNTLLNQPNGEERLTEIFQSAWDAFSYDNMDVFYIDLQKLLLITESKTFLGKTTYYITIGPKDGGYLINGFYSKQDVDEAQLYIEKIINEILNDTKGYTDYEKIRYVHDWLVDYLEYDTTLSKDYIRNIYGAIRYKTVVCEGYAKLFKYILDKMEIPCVMISGISTNTTGESETHAWNYVMVDNKWYAVDVTWDDPIIQGNGKISDKEKYKYFMKGENSFLKDHIPQGKFVEKSMEFELPKLNIEDY